ncbi:MULTISPECIES: ectonucleotide pyrophosphatase/phosphodiesterase [unclassified Pseudomonas]|uniref:alkaline phosphatase family protein n=1 Tax=unclassified Pseudomonas TaxID=196821 RepID=UPI00244865D3|nr:MULTISPECIES: ectonucleotide pyrophosphatase/phosphodiesterase [unclassified Pseudomonas]MDH0893251.1 ectonucleotide pyrophosphatase/phosphodiesterase [Pseudomonas sp. GD03875]MDH1064243.1 ectonucleotide pyrophosphatase/phosphodiesterase [Pseudomonas sp. GD03985]
MKHLFHRWLPLAALLLCSGAMADDAAQRVIMISVDGMRPQTYLEPERLGIQVPNLSELARAGIQARRVIGVFPTVTYPSHTSLVTGTSPARHGIIGNFKAGIEWYLNAEEIRAQTLWQLARAKGLSTGIVTWPVSYGAEVDYLVPENLGFYLMNPVKDIRDGATPGLFDALAAGGAPKIIKPFFHPDGGKELDDLTVHLAANLIRQKKPQFLLVHFLDADHKSHEYGPDDARTLKSFERIDQHLGTLRKAVAEAGLGEQTNFIVVSDHGFLPVHTGINVNAMLADANTATGSKSAVLSSIVQGGSAAFYPVEGAPQQAVSKAVDALRRMATADLQNLVVPLEQDEIERLGGYPGAVFALSGTSGYMLTLAEPKAGLLMPTGGLFRGGMHGYLPSEPDMAASFIASGPAFRQGYTVPFIRMIDIAPTIADLWGASLKDAEGRPP